MQSENSKFIATTGFINAKDSAENLLKLRAKKNLRAVILIIDFAEIENIEFTDDLIEIIKNFPIPLISAVKGDLPENAFRLIEITHLCVAEDSPQAVDAFNKGLINEIVLPEEKAEAKASELAEKISALAPLALRAYLKAVNGAFEMNSEDGLRLEAELFRALFDTRDAREGARAFFEKRAPVFLGK